MMIEKTNICEVMYKILEFIDRVAEKTKDEKFKNNFEYVLKIFADMVEFDTISIECTEKEIDFILYDYIKSISKKHHLAIFAFVDRDVEIETVNKIERLRKLSEYVHVTPTDVCGGKIQIHIGFFTCEFGEKYDVDLIAKTLLN